jgi:hypothetical protein
LHVGDIGCLVFGPGVLRHDQSSGEQHGGHVCFHRFPPRRLRPFAARYLEICRTATGKRRLARVKRCANRLAVQLAA